MKTCHFFVSWPTFQVKLATKATGTASSFTAVLKELIPPGCCWSVELKLAWLLTASSRIFSMAITPIINVETVLPRRFGRHVVISSTESTSKQYFVCKRVKNFMSTDVDFWNETAQLGSIHEVIQNDLPESSMTVLIVLNRLQSRQVPQASDLAENTSQIIRRSSYREWYWW